jgi:peptidylprolyl isomerase
MPFQKGDFILIDYIARIKDTDEVFDTTIEAEAKKFNIYRSDVIYESMLVVLGEGWVVSGLEEKLYEMSVGEKREIEVPPEKGFGVRDPSKVRLIPLRMFKGEPNLRPGARVRFRDALATVRSISSGRVQLDFNHPLAGKTLKYEVEVKDEVKEPINKIKALLHRRLPTIPTDNFSLSLLLPTKK